MTLDDVFEVPAGWEIVTCRGGAHDGARFWALRPPRSFRVVAGGEIYTLVCQGNYLAEGTSRDDVEISVPVVEQMSLA